MRRVLAAAGLALFMLALAGVPRAQMLQAIVGDVRHAAAPSSCAPYQIFGAAPYRIAATPPYQTGC